MNISFLHNLLILTFIKEFHSNSTIFCNQVFYRKISSKLIPKKPGSSNVTQAITSLARMTLRQLRQMASDLGVTLYSRKSKEDLVSEIAERQERRGGDLKAIEAELTPPSQSQSSTRVVFLPRDPQWA